MPLTRTHVAFLGIISLFTGLIGAGVSSDVRALSYLMTNFWGIAVLILILLILSFYYSAKRSWRAYRITVIMILIGIVYILIMSLSGDIRDIKNNMPAASLSWGWIFLVIGSILLISAYRNSRQEEEEHFSEQIDTIIGILGGFSLTCILAIIVISSFSIFSHRQKTPIIEGFFGSGGVISGSGIEMTRAAYASLSSLSYDRSDDTLSYIKQNKDERTYISKTGKNETNVILNKDDSILLLGQNLYRKSSGSIYSGSELMLGTRETSGERGILTDENSQKTIIFEHGRWTLTYTGSIENPILSEDGMTLAWTSRDKNNKKTLFLQGKQIGNGYEDINHINLSRSGRSISAIVTLSGETYIMKNGEKLAPIEIKSLVSYISNGEHVLYVTEKNQTYMISFDASVIAKDLEEVREIFLEKDGSTYAYFSRPLGASKYCLSTRYRGNICGLDGYMNPRVGADGSSIIFGGYRDGKWSLYRNNEIIIKDTGYSGTRIQDDYLFFDTTNPRTYLFAIKDPQTGKYHYLKSGKNIPGEWNDIGTDVSYGYDDHIITTAKDDLGWRIVEL